MDRGFGGDREKQRRGRAGESAAAGYLVAHGYEILATNVRCARWELDMIARHGDILVFVEVRSRSTLQYGCPSETVNHRKQQHIARAASLWLRGRQAICPIRFDVIAVTWRAGRASCRHFPDAFRTPH